jgi:hypothetical protein
MKIKSHLPIFIPITLLLYFLCLIICLLAAIILSFYLFLNANFPIYFTAMWYVISPMILFCYTDALTVVSKAETSVF